MESAVSNQPLSFAARIEADEQRYAALMAQAKGSLARIQEIGEGFGKVREAHDARADEQAVRAMALLSRIAAENAGAENDEMMEISQEYGDQDQTMEGNEQLGREDAAKEDDGMMMMEVEMGTANGGPPTPLGKAHYKPEDSDFTGLMERAKKLLARITMDGDDKVVPKGTEAVQEAKRVWTEEEYDAFWHPM